MSNADTTGKSAEVVHDWSRFDAMTEEERHAAAMADPDAIPMSDAEWDRAPSVPWISIIRRAFELTREEFSARYPIPMDLIDAWEDGRSKSDAAVKAYLHVIAHEPELVAKALAAPRHRQLSPLPDDRPSPVP